MQKESEPSESPSRHIFIRVWINEAPQPSVPSDVQGFYKGVALSLDIRIPSMECERVQVGRKT